MYMSLHLSNDNNSSSQTKSFAFRLVKRRHGKASLCLVGAIKVNEAKTKKRLQKFQTNW